jgi:transposase InsO family protein
MIIIAATTNIINQTYHNLLISNPRDLPAMIKDMSKWKFSGFVGLNTLFVALCNNEEFRKLDFSSLKLTLSGGMALQQATAERYNRTLQVEWAYRQIFNTNDERCAALAPWLEYYNYRRPHSALGHKSPASIIGTD